MGGEAYTKIANTKSSSPYQISQDKPGMQLGQQKPILSLIQTRHVSSTVCTLRLYNKLFLKFPKPK